MRSYILDNGDKGKIVPIYLVRTKGKIKTDEFDLVDIRCHANHANITKNESQVENVEL